MRIAIITDDYLPKSTLVHAKMLHELALQFQKSGHEPVVITPGLPTQKERLTKDFVGGVCVWRFRNGKIRGVGKVKRALSETMLSFNAWRAIRKELLHYPFDGVVYYSPSIFFGLLVRKIKRTSDCPAYLILRDSFPQWAVDEGIIKKGSIIERYFRFFETLNYQAADRIGLMSPKNLEQFDREHDNRFDTEVLYNWADINSPCLEEAPSNFRQEWGDKVVFFYGGNMGHAQDMANLMRLAVSLKEKKNVHFLFVGQGDEVPLVKEIIQRESLDNTTLLPSVPQDEFKHILSQIDVGLFSLAYSHQAHNFPGKLLGYMVESKPILGSVNPGNDLLELLSEAGAGHVFINGEDDKLLQAAVLLADNIQVRVEMGKQARSLASEKFSVDSATRFILAGLQTSH